MSKIAVIGVGSPFGNDSIAYRTIECLKQEPDFRAHLHYYDRPGWYLLNCMKPFDTVHLVDAMISSKPPGTLYRYEDIHAFKHNQNLLSSHGFGLAETLLLGEALNELPTKLIIHGIEISLDSDAIECLGLVAQIKQEILNAI
ncbi:MAG: hydrogenase maturation protease [Gammaproteobacteria bacterium]|nr:hydrogenase maturation protease [Gammaproteobacteria bacterium]